jgi:hypothetical protein
MLTLGRSRFSASRRLAVALATAAVLAFAVTAQAGATLFGASVAPGTASAGSTATYQVTIRNLLGPPLGSANVQIPSGWSDASAGTPVVRKPNGKVQNRQWTAAIVGGVLQLRSVSPGASNKLPLLWSVKVAVTVTAPCASGAPKWTSAARTGSNFDGLPFILLGAQPSVAVSGTCNLAETTIPGEVGTPAEGETCNNATTSLTSCLFVNLPNGANGPVQLITHSQPFGDLPSTDRPWETFQSVLGNFKDGEDVPIYTEFDPAFLDVEIDASLVDFCEFESERTIQGVPCVDEELWASFPSFQGGAWFKVPFCDYGKSGYQFPLVDYYGEEVYPACIQEAFLEEDGDYVFKTQFFDDPRWSTK